MKIPELISALSRATNKQITQAEIARALMTNEAVISNKKSRGSEVTVTDLILCSKFFEVPIEALLHEEDKVRDAREIIYYENENLGDLIRHPDVTSVWKDRQVLEHKWHKDVKNLRAISMFGDSMDGGARPIKSGDMLIIDITETNPLASGIFAYTTSKQDKLYVSYIKEYMGDVTFTFNNPMCGGSIVKTSEELEAKGFKIIGRVIHNDSEVW